MEKGGLKKLKIPDSPGVYFFLGKKKEILYIGKATSLKNRIGSYFVGDLNEKRSPLIEKMVSLTQSIEWTVTDSVLEALILETNLIRTHRPTYNTVSKDDKSYNHLIITKEDFPRVLVVRAKDLTLKFDNSDLQAIFGPFPSSGLLNEALKIVRKLFQYYDTSKPLSQIKSKMGKGKIDFNRQIGLYPESTSKKEYNKTIKQIRLFFEGKKSLLIKALNKEMLLYAKKGEFEKAEQIKRKIFALNHIQDIALIKDESRIYRDANSFRVEAYDIAHLSGKDMVGVMVVLDGGVPSKEDYRKFKIKTVDKSNDTAALKEVIERRLGHSEWPLPQIIVVDGGVAQKNVMERTLKKYGILIPVIGVIKDDKHKPKRIIGSRKLITEHSNIILLANAESHRFAIAYHRNTRNKRATK